MSTSPIDSSNPLAVLEWINESLSKAEPNKITDLFQRFSFQAPTSGESTWRQLTLTARPQDKEQTKKVLSAMKQLLQDSTRKLSEVSPAEKTHYQQTLAAFDSKLQLLDTALTEKTPDTLKDATKLQRLKTDIKNPIADEESLLHDPISSTFVFLGFGAVAGFFSLAFIPIGPAVVAALTGVSVALIWLAAGIEKAVIAFKKNRTEKAFQKASPEQLLSLMKKLTPEAQANIIVHLDRDFRNRVTTGAYANETWFQEICDCIDAYQDASSSIEIRQRSLYKLQTNPHHLSKCVANILLERDRKAVLS